MVDEKKIEETAKKHMLKQFYSDNDWDFPCDISDIKNQCMNDFKAGINWFLDNLWHDASEEPITISKVNEFVECLVKFKDGSVILYNYDTWHHWWVCDFDNEEFLEKISRWLYIKDLLKGGK